MADVFISYSRKDRDFVKRLHEALAQIDRDVWIDWEDIPLSADWWAEICAGIDAADSFVFVISPDSVRSEVCRDEIQHAVESHKRFIPILYRNLDAEANAVMHNAVSTHNWIFFREQDDFDEAFKSLINAIDTDLVYVREHTRLLVRAIEWNREGRHRSFLLDGAEVQRAEIWLADSFENDPPPTDLHYEYIRASRANESRRQRLLIGGLAAALVVALMLAALALLGFSNAQVEAGNAQTQAARATAAQGRAQIEAAQAATSEAEANIQATAVAQQRDRVATAEADARFQADIAQTQAARATAAQGRAQIEAGNAQTQAARAATAEADARFQADFALTEAAIATAAQGQAQIEAENAQTQAALAATNEAKANLQAEIAATNEAEANIQATAVAQQRDRAATAEADARFQADFAQTQAARAEIAQATAFVNEYLARSQALAVSAQRLLDTGNPDLAIALALEASRLNPTLTQAQLILNRAAPLGVRLNFDALPVTGSRAERNVSLGRYEPVPYETYPFAGLFSPNERLFVVSPDGLMLEVWEIANRERRYTLNGHEARVSAAVFSPNARYLVSGDEAGKIITWDMATGTILHVLEGHSGRINSLDYDASTNWLISGGDDFHVILWDPVQGQQITRFTEATGSHGHPVRQVFFHDDGAYSFDFSPLEPKVGVWPLGAGTDGFFRRVPVYRSVDRQQLFGFTGGDGSDFLRLWEAVTQTEVRTFTLANANEDYVPHYALRPFSRELLVYVETRDTRGPGYTVTDRYLALWDYSTGSENLRMNMGALTIDDWQITSMAVSPDGDLALTAGAFGRIPTIVLWDLSTGREIRRFTGHDEPITQVEFSTNGKYAYSVAAGNTRVWDISERETTEEGRIAVEAGTVTSLGFAPAGTGVFALVDGRDIGLWSVDSGGPIERLFAGGQVAAAAYRPTAPHVFTALHNPGSGTLWDMSSGTFLYRLFALDISARAAVFDSTGAYLLVGGNEWLGDPLDGEPRQTDTLILWDVERQRILRRLDVTAAGANAEITHVALSPDSRTAVVAYSSGVIVQWDIESGAELRRLTGQEGTINDLDYSPDGRTILAALGTPSNSLIVWDAESGDQTLTLIGHTRAVTAAAFSPDSTTAVSGSNDNSLILWDLFTGQPIRRLTGHSADVTGVAFSPDGHTVASSSRRDDLIIWRIETLPETVAWTIANRYIPELTCSQRSQYNVTPLCMDGIVPTPTATGTLFPSATPTVTPTPTPTLTPTATPIPTAIVTAAENAVIRSGPGTDFVRVGSVEPGTRVIVLQVRADIGWVQVRLPDGAEGWIAAILLEMDD